MVTATSPSPRVGRPNALLARLVIAASAVVACTDGGGGATPVTPAPTASTVPGPTSTAPAPTIAPVPQARWTVMVYLAADNDLEMASLVDAMEMTETASADLNLIVVHDRSPKGEEEPGFTSAALPVIGDWSGTRAYRVTPDGLVDLGIRQDADMTDPAVYEALTAQVLQIFPAEHQALFFWSHGGAWMGSGMDDTSNPGAILGTDALADAVGRALRTVGDDRVDLVVYDSCLMGELSAASAFADVADYLLASEESVPSHSLDYADLTLAAQAADAADFGSTLLTSFMQHAQEYGTLDTVTMSLIDLAGLAELDAALGDLAAAAGTVSGADAIAMLRAGTKATRFGGGQFDMVDLGHFAQLAQTNDPVVNAALTRVGAAVNAMVVVHNEGIAYNNATGLAAYLPQTIFTFNTAYNEVGGSSAIWGQYLAGVFNAAADAVASTPLAFSLPTETAWNGEYVAIAAAVDPVVAAGLVEATAYIGIDTVEGVVALYASPVPQVDDLVTIGGQFPAAAFALTTDDGSVVHLATLSETSFDMAAEVLVGLVPMIYTSPGGEQIAAQLVVSLRADAPAEVLPTLQLYALQENGSIGPFSPDPAGTLDARVMTFLPDGTMTVRANSELFETTPLPADLARLRLLPTPITPGSTDFGGAPLVSGIRVVNGAGESLLSWAALV